jgi:hypothetical protein
MTIFDSTAAGNGLPAPRQSSERSKRQSIGVLLTAYGVAETTLLGWMTLMATQASDGTQPWLVPALLVLSVPCCVTVVGLGLARDSRWAYWATVLLPVAVVPVSLVWIMNPHGRPDPLWVEFLGPFGGGAFFALGTVALSATLLLTTSRRSTD